MQVQNRFERLMAVAAGGETDRHLAHLILAPRDGVGCLPLRLGLGLEAFRALLNRHFTGAVQWLDREPDYLLLTRSAMREELLQLRTEEWQELVDLLERHRRPGIESALSQIIAAGCLGGDHLWRDLGFPDRGVLSELMQLAYPGLKALNDKDMKWKRFFYKQLCENGGSYVCRAPSCEQCSSWSDCFGPEV